MDNYLNQFREITSLRGLTEHTFTSYCTYIRAYLGYLADILHKSPEDVSGAELWDYIRWLQKSRNLSDRTVNRAISQLRFFTMHVLHQPWDDTQLPMRRFDEYLPYVPTKQGNMAAYYWPPGASEHVPSGSSFLQKSAGARDGQDGLSLQRPSDHL